MSNKTVISVKVDKDVRDRARSAAKKMGVPLSMVVNAELRRFANEERVTFETEQSYRMSKKLERTIAKVEADMKTGRNISGPFRTAKELTQYLDSLS